MADVSPGGDQHSETALDVQLGAVVRHLTYAEAQLLLQVGLELEAAPVLAHHRKRALKR
jgi:hypothetical protein